MSKPSDLPEITGRDYVLSGGELGASILDFLDMCAAGFTGPTWGHASLDAATMPLGKGTMTSIVARPGHGKTMLMKHLARREMKRIRDEGTAADECVAFVSLEEPPEQIGLSLLGSGLALRQYTTGAFDHDAERELIIRQCADTPLRLVAPYPRDKARRGRAEAITAERVVDAIESLYTGWRQRPTLVLIDYLQLLRTGERATTDNSRQAAVSAAAEGAKEVAIQLGVPVVLGVQAGRRTDAHDPPIPTMGDLEWSSSIEQTSDLILSLWRPIRTRDLAGAGMSGQIGIDGALYDVTDKLLIIKLLKQRWGMGHGKFAGLIDPVKLDLTDAKEPRFVPGPMAHVARTEPSEVAPW